MAGALVEINNDNLLIKGRLSFHTVMDVLVLSKPFFNKKNLSLDFSGVEAVDSSSLALLCEFARTAKSKNVELKWANLPEQLIHLIDVNHLRTLLKL
jgi:ABC-type transporter Mla MlaB component